MAANPPFNRAQGDVPPEGTFDGWGTGADGRPRLHARHWLAGTVFADGSKPEPCWCQREKSPTAAEPKAAQVAHPSVSAAPAPSDDAPMRALLAELLRLLKVTR